MVVDRGRIDHCAAKECREAFQSPFVRSVRSSLAWESKERSPTNVGQEESVIELQENE
jgi:hypothetical protein